jgi:drug/metabolite transporter (DMT)-like permease
MRVAHLILLIVLNAFWAATLSVYKPLGLYLDPASIVTLRFGMAALCLLVLWPWLPGAAPRGRDLGRSVAMGAVQFVCGQRLQVLGNHLGTAGNSSVLMALEPLLTSLAAAVFLREHIGPRRWAGFAIGMFGVALLNGVWRADFRLTGAVPSLIFISSFLCEAAYSIIGKPVVQRASAAKTLAVSLLSGTAINALVDGRATLAAARTLPLAAWLGLAYLAIICTVIGYGAWLVIIRRTDVNVAALTIFAQPVFGVALAALWLREPLQWGQLWGSLAIIAGLGFGLSRQIKRGWGGAARSGPANLAARTRPR